MTPLDKALSDKVRAAFAERFGSAPDLVARAPGRVNLIGEHTDYNDGFVLPCAIGPSTMVAASRRDDNAVHIVAVDFDNAADAFDLNEPIERNADQPWADYIRGMIMALQNAGHALTGANIAIAGNVPKGAGLSSSASLEVAVGKAMLALANIEIDHSRLAQIAQSAECDFVGTKCGIMDQLISAQGKAGHALLIDCRTLALTDAPVPDDIAIMIPNATTDQASAQKSLDGLMKMFSDNVFNFSHMAMSMWGVKAGNPNLKLTDIFTNEGAKVLDEVIRNKCMHAVADTLNYNYRNQYKSLLKDQPSNALEWTKAMVKGSVNPVKPIAPVVIYWGNKDVTNPPIMGKLYQEQMCKLGGNVNRVQLAGDQSHFTTPGASTSLYQTWIKDRLAGKPATNNCQLAAQLPS